MELLITWYYKPCSAFFFFFCFVYQLLTWAWSYKYGTDVYMIFSIFVEIMCKVYPSVPYLAGWYSFKRLFLTLLSGTSFYSSGDMVQLSFYNFLPRGSQIIVICASRVRRSQLIYYCIKVCCLVSDNGMMFLFFFLIIGT